MVHEYLMGSRMISTVNLLGSLTKALWQLWVLPAKTLSLGLVHQFLYSVS